ncbi:hypothetical protein QBC43DRAFT_375459 [Cladorrhinum sp. PSN259]|nr:hypothetical protein QBC43DRAFT_375459 [Cladorrhinum sp. PSN259]
MAEQQITQGAIDAIFNDPERAARDFPVPVLQCLQIKTLDSKPGGAAPERYRIVLSDIRNYIQCMLATQANHVVHEGQLQRGSIVRMKQCQPQHLKGKNVLIVLDLEVIESLGAPDKIGDPVTMDAKSAEPNNSTISGPGFYGAKSEPVQDSKSEVQKQLATHAPAAANNHSSTHGVIYPIEALSPYAHKWTIKARVTQKSDIKTWHKQSGDGKLFSANLLDETSEIRATGFNDAVDQFYDLLQVGQVYYISSPCRVQLAKKQFSNLPNDYELTFERDTVIEKAEDQSSVPQVRYNFCNIQDLGSVEKDTTVDLIGVLKEVHEVSQITSKTTQKGYDKRDLTLVDSSGYSVRVTIWGKTATDFDGSPEQVIAFKGTRVSDFGGRSLSLLSSGTMAIDPDIAEAHQLKGWYDSSGRHNDFAMHTNAASVGAATRGDRNDTKTIGQVKDENLGMGDSPNGEYFTLKATIVHIRQEPSFCYPACRSEGCNKKVTDMGDGTWRCEKCNISHDRPEYRYIMSINVNDHTGQMWLSCFDDTGRIIMGGKTADELMELKNTDDPRFSDEFEAANCKTLIFRCRAKMDTYADQQRIRYQVMNSSPVDYKQEAFKLADLIKQMTCQINTLCFPLRVTHELLPCSLVTFGGATAGRARLPSPQQLPNRGELGPTSQQAHAVLVGFPYPNTFEDTGLYHNTIVAHRKNLDKLVASPGWGEIAPQLLELIHPAVHSLSYLAVLNTVKANSSYPLDQLLEKIALFVSSFDARQLRYGGRYFSRLIQQPRLVDLFPAPIAVDLITTALLRLDPSGSVLTSHHCDLLRYAYMTCTIDAVLPLIEKSIVFYPGMKSTSHDRLPCDPETPSVGFITVDNEFTTALNSKDVLEHDFLRGLSFVHKRRWQDAFDAFERVIAYPIKETSLQSTSRLMAEAYNKWVLVGLLLNGKVPEVHQGILTNPANKLYQTLGKPYVQLGQAFEKGDDVERLLAEYGGVPAVFWDEESNGELVRRVLGQYQAWQIIRLGDIYTKISLEDVRLATQSADTGRPLESVEQVKQVVQGIIRDYKGNPRVPRILIEEGGDVPYLVFSDPSEEIEEQEYAERMAGTVRRLKALGPLVKATNERLATSKEYVKAVVAAQKRAEAGNAAASGQGNEYFDDPVDDEDLMTGLAAGA